MDTMQETDIENEIHVLERYADEIVHNYNTLLAKYTRLQSTHADLQREHEMQKSKIDATKTQIKHLVGKLKNTEAVYE